MQRYVIPVLGESLLEEEGGCLFSSAPTSVILQSLFSHHLSLPCVTMYETSGSLRVRGSELWKKSFLVLHAYKAVPCILEKSTGSDTVAIGNSTSQEKKMSPKKGEQKIS